MVQTEIGTMLEPVPTQTMTPQTLTTADGGTRTRTRVLPSTDFKSVDLPYRNILTVTRWHRSGTIFPFILFAAFCIALTANAQTDIYIMAGQSNMIGVQGGQTPTQNPSNLFAMAHDGSWVQARDPLYTGGGVGPGVAFADRLASLTGNPIGVVPCAVSGSSLSQWMPDYTTYTLYGCMLNRARIASQFGTIRGLVWYQGEADTMDRNNVELYSARMHVLFQAIRSDLGIPDLPIIFVQLGPDPHNQAYPYWYTIQAWQAAIGRAHPRRIGMVTAADLHAIPGNPFHLDLQSQIVLGGRIADAMYNLP
jgi:hypothetical protein